MIPNIFRVPRVQCLALLGLLSMAMAGCGYSIRPDRPELYHPRSELRAALLNPTERTKLAEPEVHAPSRAAFDKLIPVLIVGPCKTATQSPNRSHDFKLLSVNDKTNPTVKIVEKVLDDKDTLLQITLAPIDDIVKAAPVAHIVLSGCMPTKVFSASIESAKTGKHRPMRIDTPSVFIVGEKSPQTFRIYEEDCAKKEPRVSVTPPSVLVDVSPDSSPPLYTWRIKTDGKKSDGTLALNKGDNIEIKAISCTVDEADTAKYKSKREVEDLFKTVSVFVSDKPYSNMDAKLVVWSKEDTRSEFGEVFSKSFYAADIIFINRNADSLLVYGSSLTASVRFLAAKEEITKKFPTIGAAPDLLYSPALADPDGRLFADRLEFTDNFRPMSFSDVLAIFTYQQEADPRKRYIELAKSAGKLLTAGVVFSTSVDLAQYVGIFTGILVPEVERLALWDSLLYVKNMESRSLKEVEEIPPNGQLRKVVFFPRTAIFGLLPELPVYIAEIVASPASVAATVIQKQGTLTGAGQPQ